MAVDCSDNQDIDKNGFFKPKGWNDFYGICSDSCATNGLYDRYYWLGVYTYSKKEYHPEIININNKSNQALLHKMYCSVIEPNFNIVSLTNDEKEKLAEAVRDGLITKTDGNYKPNFVIMTIDQLLKLQNDIFAPLLLSITPKIKELAEVFKEMYRSEFPKTSHDYIDYHTYMDLWDFGIFTLMFAAEDGKLYLPETPDFAIYPAILTLIHPR